MAKNPENQHDFKLWEDELELSTSTPESTARNIELILLSSNDPIDAAKKLSVYSDSFSNQSRDDVIRKSISELNYYFMGKHATDVVTATVYDNIGIPPSCYESDMSEFINELKTSGSTKIAGRLGFFERHQFYDANSSEKRYEFCLRMYESAFLQLSGGDYHATQVSNYVTLPMRSVGDYQLHREEA
jgi:hypothetical protein